jgi:hypothetical protein
VKNRFVFKFENSGFFSEVNNFILALLYAKKNNYEIILDVSNFKTVDEDTLKTILDISNFKINSSFFISRATSRSLNTYLFNYFGIGKFLRFFSYFLFRLTIWINNIFQVNKIELLQDHWILIRKQRLSLSLEDKIFIFNVIKDLWIHKSNFFKNENFVGVHIRRGDKITETNFISLEQYYLEIIKRCKLVNTQSVFIFTDLKEEGEFLKSKLIGYKVELKFLDEKGYFHQDYLKLSDEIKAEKTLKLCDIVNKLAASDYFIGTNDGNLSAFVSILRNGENVSDLRDEGLLIY